MVYSTVLFMADVPIMMYHITQNELNLMGFGPRPMEFASFVEDAHFRELFARAGTVIENQHRRIMKRVHRRNVTHVDLTQLITWSDEQFIMRPLARRTHNLTECHGAEY